MKNGLPLFVHTIVIEYLYMHIVIVYLYMHIVVAHLVCVPPKEKMKG